MFNPGLVFPLIFAITLPVTLRAQKGGAGAVKAVSRQLEKKELARHLDSIYEGMTEVAGGRFLMGSKDNGEDVQADEKPQHLVEVGTFLIGRYEVTFGEFGTFVRESAYKTTAEKDGGSFLFNEKLEKWEKKDGINWRHDVMGKPRTEAEKMHPVIHVSWDDAQAYINWLNEKSGKCYRLPTEAEWEYTARGGKNTKGFLFPGSNEIDEVAWYSDNSNYSTLPAGQKKPNELGIYDMCGNVWEWCSDFYSESYYGSRPEPDANPTGPAKGEQHTMRGGSWHRYKVRCRPARRAKLQNFGRLNTLGFRLALTPATLK